MAFLSMVLLALKPLLLALAVLGCSMMLCSLHGLDYIVVWSSSSPAIVEIVPYSAGSSAAEHMHLATGALLMQKTLRMNDSSIVTDSAFVVTQEKGKDIIQQIPEESLTPAEAPADTAVELLATPSVNASPEEAETSAEVPREKPLPLVKHSKTVVPMAPLPLPIVKHSKTAGPIAVNDGLTGDPLEPTIDGPRAYIVTRGDAEKKEEEEWGGGSIGEKREADEISHKGKRHGYVALLFFFVALLIGTSLLFLMERHLPSVPYTCALFLTGAILMFITEVIPKNSFIYWSSWMHSVDMWKAIDPHMLFFTFLPALIFAEAMKLNVPLFKKCFKQVLLLACPGLLFGTAAIATFSVYVLPYGWDWPIAIVFGCILSATDPVAVVALFGTLGVAPRLTMLISGESLLNDGTAMIVFTLMLKVTLGGSLHWDSVLAFFSRMTIVSCLFGAAYGFLSVIFIGMCAEENYHSDTMIQVIITISCAFLTFFIAESELSSSGMLATVASGVMVATYAWPRFVSKTAVHTVWEAIEFIGNTIIFFLSGLLFANLCITRREHLQWNDVLWLLVLYPAVVIIRAAMLALLWFPLRMVGTPIDWKEGIVIVWSGLRGAVGLAMAIIVDSEPAIPTRMGSRVMFLVGGLAGLTTVVNATTTPLLLHYLGLSKTHSVKEKILERFKQTMSQETEAGFKKHMRASNEFTRANPSIVKAMVPCLKQADTHVDLIPAFGHAMTVSGKDPKGTKEGDKQLERICRETFLQLLQTHYWSFIKEGLIGRNSRAARILLVSVNEALDNSGVSLNDWEIIAQNLNPNQVIEKVVQAGNIYTSGASGDSEPCSPLRNSELAQAGAGAAVSTAVSVDSWFGTWLPELHKLFEKEEPSEVLAYVALSFVAAHKRALEELPEYFEEDSSREESQSAEDYERLRREDELLKLAVAHVKWESRRQCIRAEDVLVKLEDDAEVAESEMLARKLLHLQTHRIEELTEKGVLTHKEGVHLEGEVHDALRRIVREPRSVWIRMLHARRKSDLVQQQQQELELEGDGDTEDGEEDEDQASRMPRIGSPKIDSPRSSASNASHKSSRATDQL